MTELYGYMGKLLRVNLTDKSFSAEDIDPNDLRKYLGGAGLAAKILYKELPKGIDPLSPGNKIIFATGTLTSTAAPGSGSVDLCFKSPLTGIWGESRSGSDWGPMLRKAGYDLLIVEGKSDNPVFLVVNEDEVAFESADSLKGLTTYDKTKTLKEKLGKNFEIASIGLAGENKVLYSSVMFADGSRAAGRSGAGAILGSKNLLAVAVYGKKRVPIFDRDGFYKSCRTSSQKLLSDPDISGFKRYGTTGDLGKCDEAGDWPTKNWKSNSWGKGQEFYDYFDKNNLVEGKGCYNGCILFCSRVVKVDEGKWKTPKHEGAEYESMSAFTAFIMNEDVDAAVHATYLCNKYGLDTISAGGTIAFAMDCYDNGILTKDDLDGIDLKWGDVDAAIKLLEKIVRREGIGNLLADGVAEAAKKIGKGAAELAIHVKGLEGAAHDPRSGKSLALTYGVGNTGMNHIHPIEGMAYDAYKIDFGLIPYGLRDPNEVDRYDEDGKGTNSKILHDFGIIPDIVGICKFYIYAGITPDEIADQVSKLTGWNIDGKELLKIGERDYNIQRLFNIKEGITKKDDYLPKRVLTMPEFGKYSDVDNCVIKDYDKMLKEYYLARGWDPDTGIPTKDKLIELSLLDI
jgi:aldehyde:ferredoxin oxidoreductase